MRFVKSLMTSAVAHVSMAILETHMKVADLSAWLTRIVQTTKHAWTASVKILAQAYVDPIHNVKWSIITQNAFA